MPFKEHGVLIYLDKQLLVGFNKLMGDKELGRSYAALLCFVEGLHHHGYLSKQQYLNHKKRYSVPLTKDPQQVMLEEVNAAQARKQLNKTFSDLLKEWPRMKPSARRYWLKEASEHGDIPNAVRLLEIVEEQRGDG